MIGECDFCNETNRKIKYLYDHGVPILTCCRFGCNSRRSIPSAQNRQRPFEILEIIKDSEGYMDSHWTVKIKNERGFIKAYHLKRRNYETKEYLEKSIRSECVNEKQIPQLNADIYYS